MKHDEPETMYSREWLEHERRKAWQEGYAAGWKDHRLRHRGGIQVKKILENMIIKWHQAGYSLDEIAPLVPQVPKAEIAAIIHQYDKETRL